MVAIVSGNSLGLSLTSLATLGQQGAMGSPVQGRSGEQAYVNMANGNLVLQRRDDFLTGVGQSIDAVRTYNSQGRLSDDNADNWSLGIFSQPLQSSGALNTAGSSITRTASDGGQSVYSFDSSRSLYVSTDGAGAYNTIRYDSANSQYVWTDGTTGTQERYEANSNAKLLSRTDVNGNAINYSYNANGLVSGVTDASGETTNYDYSGNNLIQIRVVAQGGVTSTRVHYSYDSGNRLSRVTVDFSPSDNSTADGKTYISNYTYDGASNRVASVVQTDGTRLDIAYVQIGSDYRVATVSDGLGQSTSYAYDLANRSTTVTDPLGLVCSYSYDGLGQLTQLHTGVTTSKPNGLTQRLFSYDTRGNVIALTDGLGHSINLQYDANGNQTLKYDPLGNTVASTYNSQNQLLTETVSGTTGPGTSATLALTARNVYDTGGKNLLRFRISAEGRVTEYRYNSLGLRTSSIGYTAAVYAVSGLGATAAPNETQMQAWALAQDPGQTERSDMAYDFRGQLAAVSTYGSIDSLGVTSQTTTTQFIYSQAGELLQTIQPNTGSVTQHVYDGLGRVILTVAPFRRRYREQDGNQLRRRRRADHLHTG